MSARKRAPDAGQSIIVAEHMADALMYLSNVARSAGFRSVSEDLLAIRERLNDEHRSLGQVRPGRRVRGADASDHIKRKR